MAVAVWGVLWVYTHPLNVEAAKRLLAIPYGSWQSMVSVSVYRRRRAIYPDKQAYMVRHTDIPIQANFTYVSKFDDGAN